MAMLTQKIGPSDELEKLCRRFLELDEAHQEAIQHKGDGHPFYSDGRHDELLDVLHAIWKPLHLKPWYRSPAAHVRKFLGEEVDPEDLK